jgi:hypothetical protein
LLNASAKISEIFIYAKDFAKKITHFFIFYGTAFALVGLNS